MSGTVFAIQERAVSENPDAVPQGKGWQEDIAFTLEARNKVQAVCGVASGESSLPANDNYPAAPEDGLRFLSVCSGIEAASVAWHPLGWRPVAFAEIEKFPSAVLAHHYPDVPNLGDFTRIDTTRLGRIDILAGGTPCQAFSVAGLRQGLDDARGNLTLKFVELAHELANGNGLRNVIWENVVGVLSDKGNAFGCFLGGLVGADAAVIPNEKPEDGQSSKQWRWSRADGYHIPIWKRHGMVSGPKGRAAWAVKDAQFFGVAQRRRRVLVVADFGNGADPAAVLFEPESVCRNSPPSREEGKGFAADVAPSLVSSGRGVERTGDTRGQDPVVAVLRGHSDYGTGAPTLRAKGGDCAGGSEALVFVSDVSPTLRAGGNFTGGDRPPGTDVDTADSLIAYAPEIARCDATREGSSQDYESTTMVAVASIHADSIGRTGEAVTPSADAAGVVRLRNPGMGVIDDGTTYNIMASGQPHAVCVTGDITHTLKAEGADASEDGTGRGTPIVSWSADVCPTLGKDSYNPMKSSSGKMVDFSIATTSAVRRLTPRECERLQGFQWLCSPTYPGAWQDDAGRWWTPDYTDIPWRGKPTSPDGPRYKALGNSWAVPKFVWLGKRIQQFMPPIVANDDIIEKAAA